MSISSRHRRRVTFTSGALIAGSMLLAGPAALASAAPDPAPPDYSIGGFLNNAGQFAGALGTNVGQFAGTLGTNAGQLVGVGGNNLNQFVGTLGTNGLVFAGTLGNNLVGNPPNAGGTTATLSTSRVVTTKGMKGSFQCNSSGSSSCAR